MMNIQYNEIMDTLAREALNVIEGETPQ